MKKHLATFAFAIALTTLVSVEAALAAASPSAPSLPDDAEIAALKKAFSELRPQTGTVTLKDGLATIKVPEGLHFLDKKDSQTVLVRFWGNPPQSANDVLGMMIGSPEDLVGETGWGMVITYKEDGHVDDSDAQKIDYADLLKQMKQGTTVANEQRVKNGYPAVELVGWAEPPHYDPLSHKIYWAKDLAFGDKEHTLNYCTRILGRRGVLELNAVSSISALPTIRGEAKRVLEGVEFTSGNRYADFNKSSDKMATYGLAALVAGGIAGKMGFFKMLLVGLVAAKKFVIIGVMAVVAAIKKLFGRRNET